MKGERMGMILVVDDEERNVALLASQLGGLGYNTLSARNGADAIQMLENERVDLMLLDIIMPLMNGFQVLARIHESPDIEHIPVIVISGLNDVESIVRCIQLGAEDYLVKPYNRDILKARVEVSLRKKYEYDIDTARRTSLQHYSTLLEERVREQVDEISSAQVATIFALSKLAESRDPDTGAHLDRMREYCNLLAQTLMERNTFKGQVTSDFVETVYAASPLHDVGKVGIPDAILLKPGKLTPDEFEHMKQHTTIGANTLRAVFAKHPGYLLLEVGIEIAESHHERWNGAGYPLGLSEFDIPLSARILAVADVYDALRSKRCYKEAYPHSESVEIIQSESGKHFDPQIADVFLDINHEFDRISLEYMELND